MTREEAIDILQNTAFFGRSMDDIDTAIDMAIKALEQEPKTGKWIERHEPFTWMGFTDYVCSVCGKETKSRTNFCHDCGADMRTKAESEGKE